MAVLTLGEKKEGDLILTSEPFVHVLSSKERTIRCDFCFSRADKLMRCSACTVLWYCSPRCQKKDWKFHKNECKCFKQISPRVPTESVRIMFRLLLREKWGDHVTMTEEVGGHVRHFDGFESHFTEMEEDTDRMIKFLHLCETLRQFMGSVMELPGPGPCLQLFGKMTVNSFSICDGEMRPIGVGIYLGGSIVNHSCRPNAVAVFDGTQLQVRCVRNDDPEAEVTISYLDQMEETAERQRQLNSQYYFTCQCQMCHDQQMTGLMSSALCPQKDCQGPVSFMEEGDTVQCSECHKKAEAAELRLQRDTATKDMKDAIKAIKDTKADQDYAAYLVICESCLKHQATLLHELNVHTTHILNEAADACIELKLWSKAADYMKRTIKPYRHFYHANHPNIGVLYLKLGKLELHLEENQEALTHLQQALSILEITHGRKHSLVAQCVDYLTQAQALVSQQQERE